MIRWLERYSPSWSPSARERELKWWIWLYILLWFAEGALRKWIFPGFSNQLLIVRDPLAVFIFLRAVAGNIWKPDAWAGSLWVAGVLSFVLALPHGNSIWVAVYGVRTVCLHWPLIFVFERVLNRQDLYRLGSFFLDLALPMAVLMALQFQAGPEAFISKGAGVDLGGQLDGGGGRIRPPGVFSFTSSAAQYFSLVLAFLLHRFVAREAASKLQLLAATLGVVLAVAVAISRTLAASVALVLACFLVAVLRSGIPLQKIAGLLLSLTAAAVALMFSSLVKEGIQAFVERWFEAGDSAQTFFDRAISLFSVDPDVLRSAGLMGHGIGLGTNVGSRLATGEVLFLLAEGEWERVVLEMGIVLGFFFIFWRCGILLMAFFRAIRGWRNQDLLPALLTAAAAPVVVSGQSGVPAILGFAVISAGFCLAAGRLCPMPYRADAVIRRPRLPFAKRLQTIGVR